jgi:DNA modification methylase
MPESAKSRFTTSWEHLYFFTKRSEGYVFDTRYDPTGRIMRDVWSVSNKGYEGKHFATYPVELVTPAISACCPVNGGIVLDPFAGVCSTGIAALQLGRRFIGIDINESFLKEGVNRMEKYINQERLF